MDYRDGVHGQTALHMACGENRIEMVELIWDKKAGLLHVTFLAPTNNYCLNYI